MDGWIRVLFAVVAQGVVMSARSWRIEYTLQCV